MCLCSVYDVISIRIKKPPVGDGGAWGTIRVSVTGPCATCLRCLLACPSARLLCCVAETLSLAAGGVKAIWRIKCRQADGFFAFVASSGGNRVDAAGIRGCYRNQSCFGSS